MSNAETIGRIYKILTRERKTRNKADDQNIETKPIATLAKAYKEAFAQKLITKEAEERLGDLFNLLPSDYGVSTPMTTKERADFWLGFGKE